MKPESVLQVSSYIQIILIILFIPFLPQVFVEESSKSKQTKIILIKEINKKI